ncbi:MAG: GIY-YIG nuclease family protein [Bacteroidales bacterium]|nr:GIY-YIG nuclease family protein [Bacteroidales bacterium]
MNTVGYVYILTNPSFKEDWVKIGRSSRPVDVRSKELDNTAVPLPFEIYATLKTAKYIEAEKLIHRYIERFTNLRIRDNREFFNVQPEVALDIFKDVASMLDDAEIDEVHKKAIMGENPSPSKGKHKTPYREEKKVWMLPANSKYFDLAGCFKKFGEVYWSQYFNLQTGDEAYIYCSAPDSAVVYKCSIVGHDLSYIPEMEAEAEFYIDPKDFGPFKEHNRYAKMKVVGETHSSRLGLVNLLEHGMSMAPRGALNLSHPSNAELLKYIQENF